VGLIQTTANESPGSVANRDKLLQGAKQLELLNSILGHLQGTAIGIAGGMEELVNHLLDQGIDIAIGEIPGGGGIGAGDAEALLENIEKLWKLKMGFSLWVEVEYTACLPCGINWPLCEDKYEYQRATKYFQCRRVKNTYKYDPYVFGGSGGVDLALPTGKDIKTCLQEAVEPYAKLED
jgi:hypothetical protein